MLAGDHCKEASDLGVPLVGVGFMYPQGYFHQNLTSDGWQQEIYEKLNWTAAAIEPAMTADGKPCITAVPLGNRTVLVAVWRVRVGRVTLYLLDTDLEENAPWDRELSARLYGGDRETRVQQEIILGIGGVRVLKAMGVSPSAYHLNEGHAAFVVLQRIRDLCEAGASFENALDEVRRSTVFTTHTPVAAGHDAFPFHLVETAPGRRVGRPRSVSRALPGARPLRQRRRADVQHDGAGAAHERRGQRRQPAARRGHQADVAVDLARRAARVAARASRSPTASTCRRGSPPRSGRCFERHLGPDWLDFHDDPTFADRVLNIPDEELWAARQSLRAFLFNFIRERARNRWTQEHVGAARVVAAATMFDHNTLTIGFARRFTGYKRPELVFLDPDRLARILTTPGRAVQIVFAGKAHPADDVGKHHLQRIYRRALDPMFGGRIGFVDDYDLHVAHYLVQGLRRVAEQPAQAARSQRHERDEGGDQRHAADVDRRRLVGRGLSPATTAG